MDNQIKKDKLMQQIELAKRKLRLIEATETKQQRAKRNEKLFNTGAIFDMINPELLLAKKY
jgi:DNA-binding Xre family transcriptional regulator